MLVMLGLDQSWEGTSRRRVQRMLRSLIYSLRAVCAEQSLGTSGMGVSAKVSDRLFIRLV